MPQELASHDFAITSGGYLKIEAAATGTPALCIATQWHQIPLATEFARRAQAPFLGPMPYVSPAEIATSLELLQCRDRRRALVERGLELFDGRGAERVARRVRQLALVEDVA